MTYFKSLNRQVFATIWTRQHFMLYACDLVTKALTNRPLHYSLADIERFHHLNKTKTDLDVDIYTNIHTKFNVLWLDNVYM